MNSPDISFYGMANLIMDGAALFILAGMFIYTSLYRRRGRVSDKVFFALILTDVVAAFFNGVIYILDGCDIPFGDGEFLLMAGPQKESVIRLLINGVKLSASEQGDIPEIETRYAIRNEDETTEEFTARLLALSSDSDGSR